MKRLAMILALLALSASAAVADLALEMAFAPDVASPGDEVAFFASIANLGDEAVVAELEFMAYFNDIEFGPITGNLPLAAGEELSKEIAFIVPQVPEEGDLLIIVTADDGMGGIVTAEAALSIVFDEFSSPEDGGLENIPVVLLDGVIGDEMEFTTSFSNVKLLF